MCSTCLKHMNSWNKSVFIMRFLVADHSYIYIYIKYIYVYICQNMIHIQFVSLVKQQLFFWRPWALKCPWARVATVRDNKWLVVLTQYIYNFNQSSQIWLKNNKYSAMDGYGVKAWYPLVHPKIEGKWVFIPPKKKSIFNRFWSIPNILVFSTNHLRYG